jgi:dTDP-4-dehydrorhamnose 3,5-epimerase
MDITKILLNDILVLKLNQNIQNNLKTTSYDLNELKRIGIKDKFVQENQSMSKKGVLRGLHYQINKPQGKLIQVLNGRIFDVLVDLRCNSSTFGQIATYELSSNSLELIWVPPGYAHGFYSLEDDTIIFYKVTEFRYPEFEKTLCWNDKSLNIPWPFKESIPILSENDNFGEKWNNIKCLNV